ncbi:MAG: FAD:protein FMN transferase [Gammaproteobacteria bacterium]|nr:FAD:protein FMN transferase [Gammaproteobacteria bacterium]
MGTMYTIKLNVVDTKIDRARISTDVNQRLDKINSQMSTYMETSTLSIFNQSNSQDWVDIPIDLYTVIKESLRINKLSNRAFDVTIGPVVNLWGFGPKARLEIVPEELTIKQALDSVGSQYIHLRKEPYAIKKDRPNLYIDLSAIAKGYAVDVIADYLDELSISNYMVEIGGEIKTRGINPDNKIWQIGIEKPVEDQRTVQTVVTLNNTGMATSGDYRNYFEKNGLRYSHTIDPATGKPITHKLASVTVLHPSTMTADAMATALLVLGPEHGFELALKENIAALFLIREKDNFIEKMTPQFKQAVASSE